MGRSRLGEIGVCTSDPLRSYMGPPLDRHSVQDFATHNTRKGCTHSPVPKLTDNYEVSVLSVNPSGQTPGVNPLTSRLKHQFTN